jgi:hypothetical protein
MHKTELHQIAKENNFKVTLQKGNYFLRFEHSNYAPIDFYLAKVEDTTFTDTWENTKWTDVYPLFKKKWKGVTLQMPHHYLKNLKNRYGSSWRTPKKSKGVQSRTMKKPLFI